MRAAPNLGPAYAASFDAIYPDLARQSGAMLYPFFLDGIIGDPAQHLDDGLHPNVKGVETIAARMLPAVERFLDSPPPAETEVSKGWVLWRAQAAPCESPGASPLDLTKDASLGSSP